MWLEAAGNWLKALRPFTLMALILKVRRGGRASPQISVQRLRVTEGGSKGHRASPSREKQKTQDLRCSLCQILHVSDLGYMYSNLPCPSCSPFQEFCRAPLISRTPFVCTTMNSKQHDKSSQSPLLSTQQCSSKSHRWSSQPLDLSPQHNRPKIRPRAAPGRSPR